MLAWTIKWTLISLLLILLIHYLYGYFLKTLTVPKVKDLINKQHIQYNEIFDYTNADTVKKAKESENKGKNEIVNNNNINNDMQTELKDFLSNMKKETIQSVDSLNNGNYSEF